MRKKKGTRWLSISLVVLLVIQLFTMYGFAEEVSYDSGTDETAAVSQDSAWTTTDLPDTDLTSNPLVTGEIDDLREESIKHYRMEDGTFMAVEFGEPVHYQDAEGHWASIDNTLTQEGAVTRSVNGNMEKTFATSLNGETLATVRFGNYRVGMTPVAKAGSIAAPNNAVPSEVNVAASGEPLENTASSEGTEISGTEAAAESGDAEEGTAEEVSDSMPAPTASAAGVSEGLQVLLRQEETAETASDGTSWSRLLSEQVTAEVDNSGAEDPLAKEPVSLETLTETAVSKSTVRYANAFPGADLLYENHGYDLKESILVPARQEAYSYAFHLDLEGLAPALKKDGSVLLTGADGAEIFTIPAPTLEDAAGNISSDAAYQLLKTDAGFILSVTADPAWMNAEDRAFPVTIDPSLYLHNNGGVQTTMLRSGSPNSAAPDHADQFVGKKNNTTYQTCEVVLQVESMPQIPVNCALVNATLMMAHAGFFTSDSASTSSGSLTVDAKKLGAPSSNVLNLTYNGVHGSGGLGVDGIILDYKTLSSSTKNKYASWDVTSAALDWLDAGASKGAILLTPHEANPNRFANLIGHAWHDNSPYFVVQYRNVVGLEDYYTYQEESADDAGDISINDFTQKMTLAHSDVSLSLAAQSVGLTHYFNGSECNFDFTANASAGINTCNFTNMKLGQGWKLSAQQTVVEKTIGKDPYLIYTDGDGTEHYFSKDGSTWKDEDGLNLKITKSTSGSNTIYTMTDPDAENTWVFHNGYLISRTDDNGNAVYIAYNENYSTSNTNWKPAADQSNRIVQIIEKTNAGNDTQLITAATLTYNSSNYLAQIKDYANRTTTLEYSSNRLIRITHPDDTKAEYQYKASGSMEAAYDSESKYGLFFTWRGSASSGQGYRNTVDQVKEFTAPTVDSTNRVTGNVYHMYHNTSQLTSARYYGADQMAETEDDLVVYNVFDYYGRTITSYTTDWQKKKLLGVSAGAYHPNSSSNSDTNNRLSKTASSGQHVENLLLDSGMEKNWEHSGWTKDCTPSGSGSNAVVGEAYQYNAGHHNGTINPHTGAHQLKTFLSSTLTEGTGCSVLKQPVSLTADQPYTFSAYVNTGSLVDQNFTDPEKGVYLAFRGASGNNLAKSDVISYYTEPLIEDGWERISVTFTPSTTADYDLAVCQEGVRGIAAFDDVQLETGDTMSSVNLLQDAGFDRTEALNTYWSARDLVNAASNTPPTGGKLVKIDGNMATEETVWQEVPISQSSDYTFLLSGWGKANSVFFTARDDHTTYDRFFGFTATVVYEDNTTEVHYVPFSPMFTDWQYASGVVAPKKENTKVQKILVACAYNKNANTAYFEGISLIREPSDTYTYDEKGNPVAANTEKAKTASEYYSGTSRLKSYTTPSGTTHTLTYQSGTGNIASETLNGVITSMTYGSSGVETSKTTRKGSTGPYLETTTTYDAAQHHPTTVTDANGTVQTDTYNGTKHLKTSSTLGSGTDTLPTQYWSYNANNDRVTNTYRSGYHSSLYGYTDGMPDTFTRKAFTTVGGSSGFWQRYTMDYDDFGNNTAVKVSGSTDGTSYTTAKSLAAYTYETSVNGSSVNNGRLSQMTYPNGTQVSYSYDLFDRMIGESYTGGAGYHYLYDAEGALSEQYAEQNGTKTERYTYDYDSLGRLIHSRETDGSGQMLQRTEHLYDTSNRLTAQNWVIGSLLSVGQNYTYSSADDTLSSIATTVKTNISSATPGEIQLPSVSYDYNDIRQLTRKTTTGKFYRAFAYRGFANSDRTTAQTRYMNYRKTDDTLLKGSRYDYDDFGRIAEIYPSTSTGTSSTPSQQYTYDAIGQLSTARDNSISHTYSYTYDTAGNIRGITDTPDNGTAVQKTLTYGNSTWKDLLTKVKVGNTEKSITYESAATGYISGNPITYYNGSDYTFTWQKGRQLASTTTGGTTISYTYDMSGVRSSKTVGSTLYRFDTLSGRVTHQEWGNQHLYFIYDDSNQPYAVISQTGTGTPTLYYYMLNLQGDVIGLLDADGNIAAQYRYSPWGEVTVLTFDGLIDNNSNTIGNLNPLRYRGYYYDTETGLYYLQSRYYDPALGRFINADSYASTNTTDILSYNMFAYCENDPVMKSDSTGSWPRKITLGVANFFKKIAQKSKFGCIKKTAKFLYKKAKKVYRYQSWHYDDRKKRNGKPPRTLTEAKASGGRTGTAALFHQHTACIFRGLNTKVCWDDGREAIYDSNGYLVTDPRDEGSYNHSVPDKQWWKITDRNSAHFKLDVLPWIILGNNDEDWGPLVRSAVFIATSR